MPIWKGVLAFKAAKFLLIYARYGNDDEESETHT